MNSYLIIAVDLGLSEHFLDLFRFRLAFLGGQLPDFPEVVVGHAVHVAQDRLVLLIQAVEVDSKLVMK